MFLLYQGRYLCPNDASLITVSQEYLKPISSPANVIIHKMFTECFLCAKTVQGTKGVRNYPCPSGAHSIEEGDRKGGEEGEGERGEEEGEEERGEEEGGGGRVGREEKGEEEIETKKTNKHGFQLFSSLYFSVLRNFEIQNKIAWKKITQ